MGSNITCKETVDIHAEFCSCCSSEGCVCVCVCMTDIPRSMVVVGVLGIRELFTGGTKGRLHFRQFGSVLHTHLWLGSRNAVE